MQRVAAPRGRRRRRRCRRGRRGEAGRERQRDETSSWSHSPRGDREGTRSVEAVSSDEEFETTISPDGSSWIVPKPEPRR